MSEATAEAKTASGDAPVCSNEPQKPTAVDELADALKVTKITPAAENAQQEVPEKAEEGSTAAPEAEAKPKRERVYKKKHILTRGVTGKVKWFNVSRGFGFIERDDEGADVFLHQSGVVGSGRRHRFSLFLKGGEEVEFDVAEGKKGPEAIAVSSPGGLELAPFNPRFRRGTRREPNNRKKDGEGEELTSSEEEKTPREPRDSNNNERRERPERRRRKFDKRARNPRKGGKNERKTEGAKKEEEAHAPTTEKVQAAPAVPNAHLQAPELISVE
ncbi:Oidioi.mRNA.OKI2018_I69.chr1.g3020.t1.cds [Oikopleura dioica]|uniref:Oidioi.mRNA.OKI2018_I69.chr1.g3020.t1.cds n=1 Tax=Oikopleura dioica TaxID=34765 RepID=A0ABN7SX37_OIKDI|nr:Oidioi.mRNA.OKI2018_I69.chr1.g3020.t1.cds [Oikopleura dioica]